jgi:L-rhamnose mutarotase
MKRYGSLIRLRPEHREQYLALHASVWPEVERAIEAANIRNYTIFLCEDTLFGYYEYVGTNHAADMAAMATDPGIQRWWRLTDPCQESAEPPGSDRWWSSMEEVWHHTEPAG